MKDPYAVMLQKEKDIQRLRGEIEALRSVLPLLADESLSTEESSVRLDPLQNNKWPLEIRH